MGLTSGTTSAQFCAHGVDLDVPEVLAAARRELASYKVPRQVRVVGEDVLPWLSSQKIDPPRAAPTSRRG